MKLLIVDDEKHVREAIKLLVNWDDFEIDPIFEATDGQQAIEIIQKEQPDIVFTDMLMPLVNGIQLLEWIHHHATFCKTIVISGYDDFNYVRHTIKYGGQDYILKPIDEGQLNEALSKAIAARKKELEQQHQHQEHTFKYNTVKPLYWTKLFHSIMENGSISEAQEMDIKAEFALTQSLQSIRMAILPMHQVFHHTINRFNQNLDLLSYSLANVCNEVLYTNQSGHAFHNWNANHDIAIILWSNVNKAEMIIDSINSSIATTFGHKCNFGLGSVATFPTGMKQSYKLAVNAIRKANVKHPSSRILIPDLDEPSSVSNLRFVKYQEHIRLAILGLHQKQVEFHLKQWIDELKTMPSITVEQLELWQQEMHLFEAKCLEQEQRILSSPPYSLNGSQFYIPFNEHGQIAIEKWYSKLLSLMHHYLEHIERSNKQVTISYEIAEYIDKHYNEELSLQTIADCFLLSREYISRKFKQDMHENLSDYIAKTRINHAKQLLANPHLKLIQISEMVGYADDKYFSKVFKKLEGISPNQYRKEREEQEESYYTN